jgi:hypothetical protein
LGNQTKVEEGERRMNSEIFYAARVLDEAYERLKDAYINTSVLGPVRLVDYENPNHALSHPYLFYLSHITKSI